MRLKLTRGSPMLVMRHGVLETQEIGAGARTRAANGIEHEVSAFPRSERMDAFRKTFSFSIND